MAAVTWKKKGETAAPFRFTACIGRNSQGMLTFHKPVIIEKSANLCYNRLVSKYKEGFS